MLPYDTGRVYCKQCRVYRKREDCILNRKGAIICPNPSCHQPVRLAPRGTAAKERLWAKGWTTETFDK